MTASLAEILSLYYKDAWQGFCYHFSKDCRKMKYFGGVIVLQQNNVTFVLPLKMDREATFFFI